MEDGGIEGLWVATPGSLSSTFSLDGTSISSGLGRGELDLGGLEDRSTARREGSSASGGDGVGLLEENWVMVGDTAGRSGLALPTHRRGEAHCMLVELYWAQCNYESATLLRYRT
jgi:hypothetical protein